MVELRFEACPRELAVVPIQKLSIWFDDLARDVQPQPHAVRLGREVRVEYSLTILYWDPRSVIALNEPKPPSNTKQLDVDPAAFPITVMPSEPMDTVVQEVGDYLSCSGSYHMDDDGILDWRSH